MFGLWFSKILLLLEFCFIDVRKGLGILGSCSARGRGQQVVTLVEVFGMLLAMLVEVHCNLDPVPWYEKVSMSGIASVVPPLLISAKYASILCPGSFATPALLIVAVCFPASRTYVTSDVFTMNTGFLSETTTGHFAAVVVSVTAIIALGSLVILDAINPPLPTTASSSGLSSSSTLATQLPTEHLLLYVLFGLFIQIILAVIGITYRVEIGQYLDQLRAEFDKEWQKMLDEKQKKNEDATPLSTRIDNAVNFLVGFARTLVGGRRENANANMVVV